MPRMPKRRYGRRIGRRRVGARRRGGLARRLLRGYGKGFLSVKRKLFEAALVSSASPGALSPVGPAGFDLFTVGTPVASVGTVPGYYDVPFAIRVRLNQVVNVGEFSSLFDAYRIKGCKIQLQNNYNTVAVASTVGGQIGYMPYIEYVYDEDDDAILTPTVFREKMGIRTKYFNAVANKLTINLKSPKPAFEIQSGTGLTQPVAIPKGWTWINMANTNVPHYGIKGVIRRVYLPSGAFTTSINVDATMSFDVKDLQ